MAHPARELLENIFDVCDSLDDTPVGVRKDNPNLSLRKIFTVDIANFIMYLSASDGRVSWKEADYLSELLEMKVTPDAMRELIDDNNIYSVSFEEKVPLTLQLFVKADKWMHSHGRKTSNDLAPLVIDSFYDKVGHHFINCDRDVDSNELRDLNIYLDTLRNYVRREMGEETSKSSGNGNSLKSRYEILKKSN